MSPLWMWHHYNILGIRNKIELPVIRTFAVNSWESILSWTLKNILTKNVSWGCGLQENFIFEQIVQFSLPTNLFILFPSLQLFHSSSLENIFFIFLFYDPGLFVTSTMCEGLEISF